MVYQHSTSAACCIAISSPAIFLSIAEGLAKLGDFGLVTDDIILGSEDEAGYIDHLAPEVWDTGQTTARTDIWALGMTLYRLLHGHDWYSQSPAPHHTVREGGFADKLTWWPHVSARWRRLIRSMLNDDRHLRPDCAKLLNRLAEMSDEPNWTCLPGPSGCQWILPKGNRVIRVELEAVKANKYEWVAKVIQSGPVDNERSRRRRKCWGGQRPRRSLGRSSPGIEQPSDLPFWRDVAARKKILSLQRAGPECRSGNRSSLTTAFTTVLRRAKLLALKRKRAPAVGARPKSHHLHIHQFAPSLVLKEHSGFLTVNYVRKMLGVASAAALLTRACVCARTARE